MLQQLSWPAPVGKTVPADAEITQDAVPDLCKRINPNNKKEEN
jgi:hypothetical protein